ncbi:MAG: riboflavin synthase subunit alpha [Chlamydiia bacterium]|nr:riboflavin synthase subunit alpha [Chlamydiia bacterium]
MFSGIVQETADVIECFIEDSVLNYTLKFSHTLLKGLSTGSSVSIDGICQTVVNIDGPLVHFQAVDETLHLTTLSSLKVGSLVNVERAARFGDEIGGHLLSGHVMGRATIVKINRAVYTFEGDPIWMKFLFKKGFIAIDGISLTLTFVDQKKSHFSVHLIPETLKRTTLKTKGTGDSVNIEVDAMTQAIVETVLLFQQTLKEKHA